MRLSQAGKASPIPSGENSIVGYARWGVQRDGRPMGRKKCGIRLFFRPPCKPLMVPLELAPAGRFRKSIARRAIR
jgi:hypothetical protein